MAAAGSSHDGCDELSGGRTWYVDPFLHATREEVICHISQFRGRGVTRPPLMGVVRAGGRAAHEVGSGRA
jgi:hypothetical protein